MPARLTFPPPPPQASNTPCILQIISGLHTAAINDYTISVFEEGLDEEEESAENAAPTSTISTILA